MDVRCDRCETEYELDDAIVTDAGASVQCTTCGHTFVVRKRPSTQFSATGFTPPGGTLDSVGPDVPEWTLSTDDGKVHRFRDLNILQKWIVERKVGRTERISRAGGPWLSLGDVVELAPFFNVVDEADRARAGSSPTTPTAPRAASSSSSVSASSISGSDWLPSPAASAALMRPPAPNDEGASGESRRPISEDGPTVPNRRLPGSEASPSPTPISRSQIPLPGVRGSEPSGRTSGSLPVQGRRTPPARSANGLAAGPQPSSTLPPVTGPKEGIRPTGGSPRLSPRGESMMGPNITSETHPLEADLAIRSHGGRNALVVMVVLIAAGSAGYWWWMNQKGHSEGATSTSTETVPETPSPPATVPSDTTAAAAGATTGPGAPPVVAAMNSDKRVGSSGGPSVPATKSHAGPSVAAPVSNAAGSGGRGRSGAAAATPASANGRPGRAPADAVKATTTGPATSYDRLVAEADRLLEHGKSAKADKLYAQALASRPDGVAALTGAAYVLLDRQRHFKAIETFRRALTIDPTFGPALFGIAESYRARGDSAQALGAYRQYLAISPTGTDAPAARRQIKDLESAGSAAGSVGERSSAESPVLNQNP